MKKIIRISLIAAAGLLLGLGAASAQAPDGVAATSGQLFPIDPVTRRPHLPPDIQARMDRLDESGNLSMKADREAQRGDLDQALDDYQRALALDPYERSALYGLAADCLRHGDAEGAVGYYRKAVYARPDPNNPRSSPPYLPGFQEPNAFRLMEYAALLSKTGRQQEALTVYRRGAGYVNFISGHPRALVPLPDFGAGPGQVAYTPQRLQALADVGWAADHDYFDWTQARARLDEAVALFPDSALPYFYRARVEAVSGGPSGRAAARADYDRAAQLGGAALMTVVEHIERIKGLTAPR